MKLDQIMTTLTEGLSPVLYHGTDMYAATRILGDNKLNTNYGELVGDEKIIGSRGDSAFVSTSRSRLSGFYHGLGFDVFFVVFEMDGRKLSQRYGGRSVDFFSKRHPDITRRHAIRVEYEDRIYTDEPFIADFNRYITAIHLVPPRDLGANSLPWVINKISEASLIRNDLVKIYRMGKRVAPMIVWSSYADFATSNRKETMGLGEFLDKSKLGKKLTVKKRRSNNGWVDLENGFSKERLQSFHTFISAAKYVMGTASQVPPRELAQLVREYKQGNRYGRHLAYAIQEHPELLSPRLKTESVAIHRKYISTYGNINLMKSFMEIDLMIFEKLVNEK